MRKCYENQEWLHGYREEDPMGGHDPYSSSKGMAELAISAYRRSFFQRHPVKVGSARADNVIGGEDWVRDRIVPDCIRALRDQRAIPVRNKTATRRWQYVLELLSGYLPQGWALSGSDDPHAADYTFAFNLGPWLGSNQTVAELAQEVLKHWPGDWENKSDLCAVHEASLLNLAVDKAYCHLGWRPVWRFEQAVAETVAWCREAMGSQSAMAAFTDRQIAGYVADARAESVRWVC